MTVPHRPDPTLSRDSAAGRGRRHDHRGDDVVLGGDGGALSLIGFAGCVIWLVWIVTYGVRLVRTEVATSAISTHEPMSAMAWRGSTATP
ncbi:MAG: hypothetical protein AVDCRST_MAG34-2984 [uncultured Nocardioidaceae bacterium]|uniref:Uncharacterized protein n=1 Tax=uncultured Nocardioidaceae bacterium TaxID=253824 RepID=A0A6J4MTM1_9ACTN|nr:MAG: hypothetical protein AVDCRST_MAG34-2984 [uncultured Nocardioidaceae bacterium]